MKFLMPDDDVLDDLLGEFDDVYVSFRYFWEHGFVTGFFAAIAIGAAVGLAAHWLHH
jgi:hypothetical protein